MNRPSKVLNNGFVLKSLAGFWVLNNDGTFRNHAPFRTRKSAQKDGIDLSLYGQPATVIHLDKEGNKI